MNNQLTHRGSTSKHYVTNKKRPEWRWCFTVAAAMASRGGKSDDVGSCGSGDRGRVGKREKERGGVV